MTAGIGDDKGAIGLFDMLTEGVGQRRLPFASPWVRQPLLAGKVLAVAGVLNNRDQRDGRVNNLGRQQRDCIKGRERGCVHDAKLVQRKGPLLRAAK